MYTAFPSDDLEQWARRRAGAKFGWYVHAAVYVLVNMGLAALSLASGGHWALFPALGWGLGLAAHGAAVLLLLGGGFERLVQAERERISRERP